MNKDKLFDYLKRQKSSELIKLLDECYSCMSAGNIRNVFEKIEHEFLKIRLDDGNAILASINKFMTDSMQGIYYAPFDINSKNYTNVPEETDLWFEKLAEFLTESSRLSTQGDHVHAVKCFGILFELIGKMESGDYEIAFADELGMWMLPIRVEPCIDAYINSAATILEPEDYVNAILPILYYDSHSSFTNKVYVKAKRAANSKQQALLDEKIRKQKIRIG